MNFRYGIYLVSCKIACGNVLAPKLTQMQGKYDIEIIQKLDTIKESTEYEHNDVTEDNGTVETNIEEQIRIAYEYLSKCDQNSDCIG